MHNFKRVRTDAAETAVASYRTAEVFNVFGQVGCGPAAGFEDTLLRWNLKSEGGNGYKTTVADPDQARLFVVGVRGRGGGAESYFLNDLPNRLTTEHHHRRPRRAPSRPGLRIRRVLPCPVVSSANSPLECRQTAHRLDA